MESVRLLCDYGLVAHADLSRSGQVNRPNLAIDAQVFSADGALAATYVVQCGADGRRRLLFAPLVNHPGL